MTPWRHAARRFLDDRVALAGLAAVVLIALAATLAPALAPYAPNAMPDPVRLQHLPPGAGHLLGTDAYSRDILSRLLYGARVSLAVGIGAALASVIVGAAVGLAAGLGGPLLDGALMRGVDVLLALPRIFLLMIVLAVWNDVPLPVLIVLIAASGWFETSRLVRQHARALAGSDFVTAARALGGRTRHILGHLLPHLASTIIVTATLDIGNIILIEAGLSYLGLGVRPPTPSWGNMILEGRNALFTAPWEVLAPGLALVLTVIAFNLVGDALRDALNPRLA